MTYGRKGFLATWRSSGEFVTDFLLVVVVVERGLATRLEICEPDAADTALARFEELRDASTR